MRTEEVRGHRYIGHFPFYFSPSRVCSVHIVLSALVPKGDSIDNFPTREAGPECLALDVLAVCLADIQLGRDGDYCSTCWVFFWYEVLIRSTEARHRMWCLRELKKRKSFCEMAG